MNELQQQIRQIEQRLGGAHHAAALKDLDILKSRHPNHPLVARLWSLVALRMGKSRSIVPYVVRCMGHSRSAVERATLCWLAGQAKFHLLEFEAALLWFQRSASLLRALLRRGALPSSIAGRQPQPSFASGEAEALMWQAAAVLRAAGSSAFPCAGTLLALVREQRLFPGDKDIDFAVWTDDLAAAELVLAPLGWRRWRSQMPFTNVVTFLNASTGLTIDMTAWRRDAATRRVEGGFWLDGKPASYQRITAFPWVELVERDSPAGPVNWPADPDAILTALYDDWRTPRPWFDTVISAHNLRRPSLQVQNFAYMRLIGFWLRGDLARTRDYARQCREACANDPFLATLSDELEQFQTQPQAAPAL